MKIVLRECYCIATFRGCGGIVVVGHIIAAATQPGSTTATVTATATVHMPMPVTVTALKRVGLGLTWPVLSPHKGPRERHASICTGCGDGCSGVVADEGKRFILKFIPLVRRDLGKAGK